MKISQVMTPSVVSVPPTATLQQAAELMRDRDIGALPVRDQERLIGILTDRDIAVRAIAEGRDPNRTEASTIMTQGPVYCFEDDEIEAAARMMQERQIRRIVVLDRAENPVGMLSLGDISLNTRDVGLSGEVLNEVSKPHQEAAH